MIRIFSAKDKAKQNLCTASLKNHLPFGYSIKINILLLFFGEEYLNKET